MEEERKKIKGRREIDARQASLVRWVGEIDEVGARSTLGRQDQRGGHLTL